MDAAGAPPPTLAPDASGPPAGGTAFPIAIVIAIGFVVTSLILISYYFLVVRCWLRGGTGAGPGSGLLHRARRDDIVERVAAVFFADYEPDMPAGLDPDVVAALPVVRYRRARGASAASAALECAVCLAEFAPGERLKQLPSCSHAFHIDCIDTWLHHNVSCPLCRTVVTGGVPLPLPLARDDLEASCRDLPHLADGARIGAAARAGYGSSCRFPASSKAAAAAAQDERITRSFSMDCFAGGLGRKPHNNKEPAAADSISEAGPSIAAASTSGSNVVADRGAGETSGRFRRLLSSFGLGRSSRSTVLPIHLDP
ncbi:hypothetical protein U9M48_006143 [Paspalum notatum var. saurae]|uniref:RING-type E3 ubiquitin transferase n=1 Tax=Paspalum notatum var. saurae TaxID=547442 RepID=A0AAQ3PZ30_PASNO